MSVTPGIGLGSRPGLTRLRSRSIRALTGEDSYPVVARVLFVCSPLVLRRGDPAATLGKPPIHRFPPCLLYAMQTGNEDTVSGDFAFIVSEINESCEVRFVTMKG